VASSLFRKGPIDANRTNRVDVTELAEDAPAPRSASY
jgi:hypothetical protein